MYAASNSSLRIQTAHEPWRKRLLAALHAEQNGGQENHASQFLTEITNPTTATGSAPNVLVATWGGEHIVGATWYKPQPGRVGIAGSLWLPTQIAPSLAEAGAQLLAVQQKKLVEQGCQLIQSWLPQATGDAAHRLQQAGLRHLADVHCMVSLPHHWPNTAPSHDNPLHCVGCRTTHQDRLKKVLSATYTETLDCPQLNALRDIEDVLEGYRATGTSRADGWWLLRYDDQDVGCLLLADFPRNRQIELVYLGLIPTARGKGWGRFLVRYAQWFAFQANRDQLVLAVDSTNHPAQTLYWDAGFVTWKHRSVFIKPVASVPFAPEKIHASH
ncbi:MAG: GNAT family N-acetyltransferase [Planctomycetota bacterium]|nr:GNAT family N-acetyltransferase [Planctomycetota bacterium]